MSGPGPRLMSADTLEDNKVYNNQNESLGEVEEIMINVNDGKVEYAVVEFGGFLGMGTKYFAVPWEAMQLDTKEECFRLNVTKEALENADGFDKDNWPDMADPAFAARTRSVYGL
ncbi:MAG: PRC-barrel domain-containing protein [Rhodomicrobiaceae bacterium]